MSRSNHDKPFLPDYGYGGRDLNYTTESMCDRMNDEVARTRVREGDKVMNDYETISAEIEKAEKEVKDGE